MTNCFDILKNVRLKNIKNIIIGTLNINSLPSKFDQLKFLVIGNIDILIITETKLDESFPVSQFYIEGYAMPYRLDRCRQGGGVLIYVRDDISSRNLMKHTSYHDMETLFIELNFKKSKWLLVGCYHPPSQNDQYFFNVIDLALDTYNNYNKLLLIGDFNIQEFEKPLEDFLYQHDLNNIVKEATCFKSSSNPSCIDLILTTSSSSFKHTTTLCSGLSDFHKLVISVFKTTKVNSKPKELHYRDFKNYNTLCFNDHLTRSYANDTSLSYGSFERNFMNVLEQHAPMKKKLVRANHAPYVTKTLRKAIMKRSNLETVYRKKKTEQALINYKEQKNFCSRLYKKEKKRYFRNLNPKKLLDNKLFWKNVKPFFSDKSSNNERITLTDDKKVIIDDEKICEEFNCFFEKVVESLNIDENRLLINENNDFDDPVNHIIKKFEIHPSILLIKEKMDREQINVFSFSKVRFSDIEKEIKKFDANKGNSYNIPTKILKECSSSTISMLHNIFNNALSTSDYPSELKLANVTPVFKKMIG